MIQNRDFVVIGIQAWDIDIGSNCKNIAEEIARHNRVLYVNPPLDRFTMLRSSNEPKIRKRIDVQKGRQPDLTEIGQNLWNLNPVGVVESINSIKWPWLYDRLNRRNNRIFARAILSAIRHLNFKDIILFNDSSMFLGLYQKEYIKPASYVYYMRDYLVKNPYWRRQGLRLEPLLIAKADVVVTNSTLYADYGRQYNPKSFMVGQGCDISLFDDEARQIDIAAELSGIPKPILGYVGYLSSRRLDVHLLEKMAESRHDISMVLVGPEDDHFKHSALHRLPNVHFLGSRAPEVLPSYIKGFDVCMNPQLINDATIGNYPRKIDEYLAMGKPVLATATPAMSYFKDYTYLADNLTGYLENLDKALTDSKHENADSRRKFAQSHTWQNNVLAIYNAILDHTETNE